MLDNFRKIDITWDKANRKIYDIIRASSSDENGRKLVVQVLDSGSTVNLKGNNLRLYWETKDKHYTGFDEFELIDAEHGIFELHFTTGMLSNIGKLRANLHLMNTDDLLVITSEPFQITVFHGIDNEAIESTNSFTALTEALVRLSRIEAQEETRKSNEIARNEAESSRSQAERTRKNAEDKRITNEEERKSNEVARKEAENTRKDNESTRQQKESNRESAEKSRADKFNENESHRQNEFESNENTRQSDFEGNENARQQNEQLRQNAEDTRQTNENTRKSNEQARKSTFDDLQQAMETVEQDYADRAEDLELTYSPRLLEVENELEDDVQPRLSEIEAGNFENRLSIPTDTSTEEDGVFLRFYRADGSLLSWLSTGADGTGLKLHMLDHDGVWTGYISIDEDGTLKQNGVPVATK